MVECLKLPLNSVSKPDRDCIVHCLEDEELQFRPLCLEVNSLDIQFKLKVLEDDVLIQL